MEKKKNNYLILYTKREGGIFYTLSFGAGTEWEYKKALRDGKIVVVEGDTYRDVKPKTIMLMEMVDGFDFITKKKISQNDN